MTRAMKDSGIAWIGEIPEEWECQKCKTILSANDGGVWGNDPIGDENDKVVIRSTEQTVDGKWCIVEPAFRDLSQVDYVKTRIIKDDLLITKSSGSDLHIGKTTIADDYFTIHECYFSNFIQRIRCDGFMPKLLWYLFNSSIIREQCVYLQNSTSGIGNINAGIIRNLYIPIPSVSEQRRIVFQLDAECARIDAVIEQTRASIEEYKKLKQAVITQAVTKGIRPNRPMKEVYEFEASIPDSWAMVRLKYLTTEIVDCPHETPEYSNNGEYLVIRTADQDYARLRPDESMYRLDLSEYQNRIRRLSLDRDDIVYGREGERWGLACLVPESGKYCLGQRMMQFRCDESRILPMFAVYALSSIYVHRQGEFDTFGSTSPHVNISTIRNYKLPLPPLGEQEEIQSYLDRKSAEIDDIIAKKERYLSEVQSFKKSLIFEYVTGKKEV